MKIATFADLYLDQLQDAHNSEKQIVRALPKMAEAAQHPQLKAAFTIHHVETKEHLERLNRILTSLEKGPGRKVCEATIGLIAEGSELIEATEAGDVRDAGLICAAQKIEHYEIALYGCLNAYATLLGRSADARLLQRTLSDEHATDQLLSTLAESMVNIDALA